MEMEENAVELIARDLTSIRDGELLLAGVVRRTRIALGCDMAYLSLNDMAAGETSIHATDGVTTEAYARIRMPLGTGVLGLAATGVTTETADYLPDPGKLHVEQIDAVVREEGARAILATPLRMRGTVIGALTVANRRPGSFSEHQRDRLVAISAIASAAVEITQLRVRVKAEEAERRRAVAAAAAEGAEAADAASVGGLLAEALASGGALRDLIELASNILGTRLRVTDAEHASGEEDSHLLLHLAPTSGGLSLLLPTENARVVRLGPTVAHYLSIAALYEHAIQDARHQRDVTLIDELLDPREPLAGGKSAPALKLPGAGPFDVVLLEFRDDAPLRGRVAALRRDLGSAVVLSEQRGRVIVLGRSSLDLPARLEAHFRGLDFVGGVSPAESGRGVRAAYDEAKQIARTARSLGRHGQVARPGELGVATFAIGSDPTTVRRYLAAHIAPLLEPSPRNRDLRRTAVSYLESQGSIPAVASELGLHVNTVRQRVDRLDRELGPTWRSGARSLDVHLALRTREALGDLADPPS